MGIEPVTFIGINLLIRLWFDFEISVNSAHHEVMLIPANTMVCNYSLDLLINEHVINMKFLLSILFSQL